MKLLFLLFTLFGIANTACQGGDNKIKDFCFKFVNQPSSFEDARNWCHSQNTFLAYVPDSITSNFLASYSRSTFNMTDGYVWIGLSKNGTYQWDDGQPVGYTNFGGNNGQNYVGLGVSDGKWYTFADGEKKNFVCSYDYDVSATTTMLPTTKGPSCTPSTPRTFLFAYSTDLDFDNVQSTFANLPMSLNVTHSHWNTFANVRLDMKDQEEIVYSKDTGTFSASLNSHKPDPSLGYKDSTTGSNMFSVIGKFLNTTESICGSTILIAAKRYPSETELEDLITLLQNNYIFVYFIASDTPSGGNNPSAMFNVATRTNGFCVFSDSDAFDGTLHYTTTEGFIPANQIVAQEYVVSGKGNQTFSFQVPNGNEGRIGGVYFGIIFQDHKVDGSLISLRYIVTDESGNVLNQPFNYLNTDYTAYFDSFIADDNFILKIDYEYVTGQQEVMEIRMFAKEYTPDNWLPYNT